MKYVVGNRVKALIKSKVVYYWEKNLREEVVSKTSLVYFKPQVMSLSKPHPLWTTCGDNSFKVNKSCAVAILLNGRYASDRNSRHWSVDNKMGNCLLCPELSLSGDIPHLFLHCHAPTDKRQILNFHSENLRNLFCNLFTSSEHDMVQFLLVHLGFLSP